MTATAPAATAGATKRRPSSLVPATATNRSPGFTVRLSAVTPRDVERGEARIADGIDGEEVGELHGGDGSTAACSVPSIAHDLTRPHAITDAGCDVSRRLRDLRLTLARISLSAVRQVEARLDAEQRRDARDDGAADRRRVPARGGVAVGLRDRLRLVEHDQHEVARLVGRQHRGEAGQQLGLGVAAVDHLLRGAGLAADIVAVDVGLAGGALLGVEPHQVAHLLAGLGLDHAGARAPSPPARCA